MNVRSATLSRWAAAMIVAGAVSSAQGALIDYGGGLIYDDVLDITWLQDANYSKTSGYDADGRMSLLVASDWADNLKYFDSVRNVTYTDWQLTSDRPLYVVEQSLFMSNNGTSDLGYAKTGDGGGWGFQNGVLPLQSNSQLGYMYYVNLANKGRCTPDDTRPASCAEQAGWGLANTGSFTNLQSAGYWHFRNYFDMSDGSQNLGYRTNELYAWAIRPGAPGAPPIPEPATIALWISGLLALLPLWRARRRQVIGTQGA